MTNTTLWRNSRTAPAPDFSAASRFEAENVASSKTEHGHRPHAIKTIPAAVAVATTCLTAFAGGDLTVSAFQEVQLSGSWSTVTLQGLAHVDGGSCSMSKLRVSNDASTGWSDGGARLWLNDGSRTDVTTVEVASGGGAASRILYVFNDSGESALNIQSLYVYWSDIFRLAGNVSMAFTGGTVIGKFDVQKENARVTLNGELMVFGEINLENGVFIDRGLITGNGVVNVKSQGTFCGDGAVQNLKIETGGTLRAGDNGGTLTVAGDIAMSKNAVLDIFISSTTNSCLDFVSDSSCNYTAGSNVILRISASGDLPYKSVKIMDWSQTDAADDSLFDPANYVIQFDSEAIYDPELEVKGSAMYLTYGHPQPAPPGSKYDPWAIGESVCAYTNGVGGLVIAGEGATSNFTGSVKQPWSDVIGTVKSVELADAVAPLGENLLAGLGDDVTINGETIARRKEIAAGLQSEDPAGEISGGEFERIEIVDGFAKLAVGVYTNSDVTATIGDWGKAEIEDVAIDETGAAVLTVPSPADKGFMILKSKTSK